MIKSFFAVIIVIMLFLLCSCGGDTDRHAIESPGKPPFIITQPVSTMKMVGDNASFNVTAEGADPLNYQWQINGNDIVGANSSNLIIESVKISEDGSKFRVKLTNSLGVIYSAEAILNVSTEIKNKFIGPPPTVNFSSLIPASGENIIIKVGVVDAFSISLVPNGEGCGSLVPAFIVGSQLEINGSVGTGGNCIVVANITSANGTATYTNEFTVTPLNVEAQGIVFKNGIYFPSGKFSGNISDSTIIEAIDVPKSLTAGEQESIYITTAMPLENTKAIFKIQTVPGYFVVFGREENNKLRFDVTVSPLFLKESSIDRNITAQLVNSNGGLSESVSSVLSLRQVNNTSLQIQLSFDQNDDLDLHVITPANEEIYYKNKIDTSGGTIDVDSNAECINTGSNQENLTWPSNFGPKEGVYKVRAALYASCSHKPVNYSLKITNCGIISTYTGVFNETDANPIGLGAGRDIAQFKFVPCNGFSVAGRATYDDYPQMLSGLSTLPRELPIRNAMVEVRALSGDNLLAQGDTNENGEFLINFKMTTTGKYYLKVIASQNNNIIRQKVTNGNGEVYAIRSVEFDPLIQPQLIGISLHAQRDSSFAEAFNIFDVGVNSFKEAAVRVATALPLLTWEWTKGTATCGGAASCYNDPLIKIFVLSALVDEDAYDDTVLAHEFGHFFMHKLSSERSTGGPHSSGIRSAPLLAWSEGAATFFGQQVMRSPQYIDTNAGQAFGLNIEDLPGRIPRGTDDNSLRGNVSEATVAAILWDLADEAQDSLSKDQTIVRDVISNADGVFSSLSKMTNGTDRATPGPDLVDFLDTYICLNYASWEPNAAGNFRGLITVLNGFPYTPEGKPPCLTR